MVRPRDLDSQSRGHEFDSMPFHFHVTASCSHTCASVTHQAV